MTALDGRDCAALVARLRAYSRGQEKLHFGDEVDAADTLEDLSGSLNHVLSRGASRRARTRADALDEAADFIEQTLRGLEETGPRTDGTEVLLQRLRVAFGFSPQPGECLAPGFAAVVNALPE